MLQIKVQSVRSIGSPRPTAGMWSSRVGGSRCAIGMTGHGLSDLCEACGVGPGGDGKQGVGQRT